MSMISIEDNRSISIVITIVIDIIFLIIRWLMIINSIVQFNTAKLLKILSNILGAISI